LERLVAGVEPQHLPGVDQGAVEVVEGDEVGDADPVRQRDVVERVTGLDGDGARRRRGRRAPREPEDLARPDLVAGEAVELLERRDVGTRSLRDAPEGVVWLDRYRLGVGNRGRQGTEAEEGEEAPG